MFYVSIQVLYHLTYLAAVFHLSKLSWAIFGGFVLFLAGLIFLSTVVLVPMTQVANPTFPWLIGLGALAAVLGAVFFLATNRLSGRIPLAGEDKRTSDSGH
jgi:hypothetical protein